VKDSVVREHSFRPLGVVARPNEDADRLIRRFMRKVQDEGIIQDAYDRRRRGFETPSQRRRRKIIRNAALRKKSVD